VGAAYVVRVRKVVALLLTLTALGAGGIRPDVAAARAPAVRVIPISYRAHDGLMRRGYVIVPANYGRNGSSPIPLVISPHGRGVGAKLNVKRWAGCRRPVTLRSSIPRARAAH
jgi:hypothetical protein